LKVFAHNEYEHPRLFEEKIAEIRQDLQIFEPYRARMHKRVSTDLDLMFIVDCTKSMTSWIEKCKEEVKNIITYVKNQHEGVAVRVAFIGYRDISNKEREFSIKGFTEDIEDMKQFIGGI
jgi:vacuole morphology and inheritance protein 14